MMFDSVKIMGERNSGTNFLQKSVYQNFAAHIHLNTELPPPEMPREFAHGSTAHDINDISEDQRDAQHVALKDINGGWKHAALHLAALDLFSRNRNVLFLGVVRHPATWLHAMHRFPIHAVSPTPEGFSAFIREPWPTRPRDELAGITMANPVALWVIKNRLLQAASQARKNLRLLRYETLVEDFDGTLGSLPLVRRNRPDLVIPIDNARGFRGDKTDFYAYKARIAMDPWTGYTDDDKAFVLAEIDTTLMSELRYH